MSRESSRTRVHVFANLAVSLDGKIDSFLREGGGFSSRYDRDRLDAFRTEADVLIVGAGTIRVEDPPLRIRDPSRRRERRAAGRAEELAVVVVSRSGNIPARARFLREPAHARLLVLPQELPASALAPLAGAVEHGALEVLRCGEGEVALPLLFEELGRRGYRSVLVEGGGGLIASLLDRELLDEIRVTLCPTLIGGRAAPTLVDGEGWPLAHRLRLRLVEMERVGDEIFLRYRLARGEES